MRSLGLKVLLAAMCVSVLPLLVILTISLPECGGGT
jgi:hypothetical protein